MGEFDLIRLIRKQAGPDGAGVRLGIGDDAAVLDIPNDRELVVTTDTLNAGVHFFEDAHARDIGYKALAVNLSDLAAMGAEPRWALLALSLPEIDESFTADFMAGFLSLARRHAISLAGGDICSGPLSVTVTAMGLVEPGRALTRNGAQPGDLVVVSGTPGMAALALDQTRAGVEPGHEAARALSRPLPRVALGAALVGKASACIDISDGLLADLGHIVEASGCGAVIELGKLPGSGVLEACDDHRRWRLQLTGGDDYELCFTLPPEEVDALTSLAGDATPLLSVIGSIEGSPGIRCLTPGGALFETDRTGYEHFT